MIGRPGALSLVKARLAAFREDERASLSIETVVIFPLLLWVYLAMFVFFDAFRSQSLSDKAAYTIADLISREDHFVTNTYLDTVYSIHGALARSHERTQMRISMVRYQESQDRYRRVWSRNRGGMGNLNNAMLRTSEYRDRLPVVPNGEKFVLVETATAWRAPFNLDWLMSWISSGPHEGAEEIEFRTFTVTRPRTDATQVCFKKNNGDVLC